MRIPSRAFEVADRARRLMWKLIGPRTVGVRGIVVDDAGRVLLVRHTYGPALWHLPGGGVKRRESLVSALRRELFEEAGVIVEGTPVLHGVFSNLAEGKSDHVTVFVVREWRSPGPPEAAERSGASSEIESTRFFAANDLPPDVSRGTARRIAEWAAGAAASSFDW